MTRALTTRECSVNLRCHLLFSSPKPEPPRSHPGLPSPIQNVSQSHSVFIALFYLQKTQIKHFNYSLSKLIHFFFSFWHKEISQMDPKINQKPIRFISYRWSRGSHKIQTDRQTDSITTVWKNKQGPHSPHSKILLPDRQGWAGEGSFSAPKGQWALGGGGAGRRMRKDRHHS